MSEVIISVENLGKCYQIGNKQEQGYTALRDVIANKAKNIFKGRHSISDHTEDFWALKDVNFEIKQGEAVGIIGRNGAGKSTLLKLLSRITEPSTGKIILNGRVASLLEVGTGFHPELTGRENIYLNGAILGMGHKEIKSKFDEIVDFSGVEKFLDTPVKRYSSGMYVRLAFAVAAHLEPEILVVDEVLAVGDAEFQKKCLGKMNDVAKGGRTVLFVSHNMPSIQKLCNKAILLGAGSIVANGSVNEVLGQYILHDTSSLAEVKFNNTSNKTAFIEKVVIEDEDGNVKNGMSIGEKWKIKVYVRLLEEIKSFITAVAISNEMNVFINTSWQIPFSAAKGLYCAEFHNHELYYSVGTYYISVGISEGYKNLDYVENKVMLNVNSAVHEIPDSVLVYNQSSGFILNTFKMKTEKFL